MVPSAQILILIRKTFKLLQYVMKTGFGSQRCE